MLVYLVYDKNSGRIIHMHRAVDAAGRGLACSQDDVLASLPESVRRSDVEITQAEIDSAPSSRDVTWSVDPASGRLRSAPVVTRDKPARAPTARPARARKRG